MKHVLCALAACVGLATRSAHADVAAAARAFSDGQAAQLEGNYERAAQNFELAYDIAPSKEALRSAVRARQLANQLPRAATLAQLLLVRYGADPTSAKLANDLIAEAMPRLGRVSVSCTPLCTVVVGGRAVSLKASALHVVFTAPGTQVFEMTFDGTRTVKRELTMEAGDDIALPVEPASAATAVKPLDKPATVAADKPASPGPSGLPPYWAISGAVVTVALGGVTAWSAVDTKQAHDEYLKMPTTPAFKDGQSRQLRTNILLGGTAATGIGTALIFLFWTRHDAVPAEHGIAVSPEHGGATLTFNTTF